MERRCLRSSVLQRRLGIQLCSLTTVVILGCTDQLPQVAESETTRAVVATTSTSTYKGKDCNKSKLQRFFTQSAFRDLSENAKPEQLRPLMMTERQRIRSLDLPTLQREKQELVDSMEQMIIELTQSIANKRRSGAYDAALIRWDDASKDFLNAYVRECEGL